MGLATDLNCESGRFCVVLRRKSIDVHLCNAKAQRVIFSMSGAVKQMLECWHRVIARQAAVFSANHYRSVIMSVEICNNVVDLPLATADVTATGEIQNLSHF